jgi:hypothetical protein
VEVPSVAVLIEAGLQVPVMAGELVDVAGSAGGEEFWQSGPMALNVGAICGVISINTLTGPAHCPNAGVKV